MIDSNCNKYALELVHNKKVKISNPDTNTFSYVYQQIINISRNAPVYLIYPSEEINHFATQIKNLSMQLTDHIKKFFEESEENPFHLLKLSTPPTNHMNVRMLKQPTEALDYEFEITSIAQGQKNLGNYVVAKTCPFTSQTYGFRIYTDNQSFDFEVSVTNSSSNEEILQKIADLINRTTEKLEATLLHEKSKVTLSIVALANKRNSPATFDIEDTSSGGLISYYNLSHQASAPTPSIFYVNGELIKSYGTAFVIDDLFEILLLAPSEEIIRLNFEADYETITSEIQNLQSLINQLLTLSHSCEKQTLSLELSNLLFAYKKELEEVGIQLDPSCFLSTDELQLKSSIQDHSLEEFFSADETFGPDLIEHTQEFTIDPMKYVPSKVVSYKDSTKINYPNPYMTSMYSGFIFTGCC